MKKVLPAIISLLFTTQVLGFNIEWKEEDCKGVMGRSLSAPFTADDVIEHATAKLENYKMDFLRSEQGKGLIEETIKHINQHMIPNPDKTSIAASYNRSNPGSGYNKSLIADFVSSLQK